ncbi:group 10 secretory phospholipase A2 isoform X2 [Hemicordylus capensis]|uniref:group 10 secretory phospholipase A2 isoform X2 n=1 Tax=Hemicordylus capensis TaxID=884348 RepID=UPI00230323BC|nr:group 10 secretory phospholipase A2 isoform X2 [Hemicordylus capensis]
MGPAGRLPALLLLLLLLPTASEGSLGNGPSRTRRGLLQLAGAIQCTTGRTPFAYLRYGCYCGLGGAGWPRDKVDWCCFEHDCCYEEAEKAGCAPKTQCYTWECEGNAAKCEHIEDQCQKKACECDRKAAKCLAKAPYDVKNIFWPDALCGKDSPKCKDDD